MMLERREMMAGISGAALVGIVRPAVARAGFTVPDGACDCHHHIYDPARFAYQGNATLKPPPATLDDYRRLQNRLGISRSIVVTPSTYGTDNRVTLDALEEQGDRARGIAVIHADLPEADLRALHTAGMRGVRIQFGRGDIVGREEIEPLARRIASLGWHIQFNLYSADDLAELAPIMARLPVPSVLDHLGHIPMPEGMASNSYKLVRQLLDSGRCWVKLSAPYTDSKIGPPDYPDTGAIARSYAQAAPERCVWASNWPFPNVPHDANAPDALAMLNLLPSWVPDAGARHRILVENPEALYGFDPRHRPKRLTG